MTNPPDKNSRADRRTESSAVRLASNGSPSMKSLLNVGWQFALAHCVAVMEWKAEATSSNGVRKYS
jgi:hypothetical protein